jgi:hypothetical protein
MLVPGSFIDIVDLGRTGLLGERVVIGLNLAKGDFPAKSYRSGAEIGRTLARRARRKSSTALRTVESAQKELTA